MFTGIVQAIGNVTAVEKIGGDVRLRIAAGDLSLDRVRAGDSIAVNGVCLTAIDLGPQEFSADVSRETLGATTLGQLTTGDSVNLEPSLTLADPLGGHMVSGHIDGVSRVVSVEQEARSVRLGFDIPESLTRYIARKGSVSIDGTSLTVNEVSGTNMFVNIVPHTLEQTIMSGYSAGTSVNIEVDLIARYLERLIQN